MRDALVLGMLKLEAVKRLALDNQGAAVISYAFIAALVVVASFVAANLADAGLDRLLDELFFFIKPD